MSIYKRGCDKKGQDRSCSRCGKRRACGVYWYRFMWQGKLVRESTKQGNDKVARQMEAAHKTSLAKGEVGIREKKPVPTLAAFCKDRVEPWAKAMFESTCRNNWHWFRAGIRRLTAFEPIAKLKLSEITNEHAAEFAAHELGRKQSHKNKDKRGLAVSSVNSSLRVLRRILHLGADWGLLETVPKINKLPGERRRERVISIDEEARYLAAAPEPLASIATVLADTGMRPDECYRLRWEQVTWANGRYGTILVTHGKTAAARRPLPMTQRVRAVLDMRWERVGRPSEGWLWPAPARSGHVEHCSLKKQHARAFRTVNAAATKNNLRPLRTWVLYSFRHTFLTRLAESGCDAWTLARIAGHSSVAISSRYVHPSDDAVFAAVSRVGGHSFGHSPEIPRTPPRLENLEVIEEKGEDWCARRDSNSRPIAPEAIALSI
jgi:integrase